MAVCMRVWYGAPAARCYTARMQRPLGNLGVSVAPIGLGGMPLSIQGRPDESTALAVIAAFLEGGGTHIDTAISYCLDEADFGHNERLIAKALRTLRRTDIVVATKGGLTRPNGRWEVDCSPIWLRRCCEQSAHDLGGPIALYYLHTVDPAVPLYFADTSDRRYDDVVALPRFVAGLVSGFSTIALLLAGVGIFGVTAYAVSQRRREFGIRLALGAQRTGIGGLVLRRVAVLAGVGIVAGAGIALALGSTIGSLLFGVQPDDPATFAVAAGTLALTAMVAAVAPMRAAVRVDPAVTLKADL